jgi:hypothetical protein
MNSDYDIVSSMRDEIACLRSQYGHKINEGLLSQIEERNIIFVEDGIDVKKIINDN